jgi:hypothetical protein
VSYVYIVGVDYPVCISTLPNYPAKFNNFESREQKRYHSLYLTKLPLSFIATISCCIIHSENHVAQFALVQFVSQDLYWLLWDNWSTTYPNHFSLSSSFVRIRLDLICYYKTMLNSLSCFTLRHHFVDELGRCSCQDELLRAVIHHLRASLILSL